VPRLALEPVTDEPFEMLGQVVIPIPLRHGRFKVHGYRIGDVAYCTDTNGIPAESEARLQGLDVLILDCLRRQPHATHFGLDEAIAAAERISAKRTLFTHMCHDLGHDETTAGLPSGMELAYDGLKIPLSTS